MRKQIRSLIAVLVLAGMAGLLPAGCQPEAIAEAPLPHEGEQVKVQLRLNLSLPDHPAVSRGAATSATPVRGAAFTVGFAQEDTTTRAVTRTTALALYNLWVFQFKQGGALVGKPQQVSTSQTAVQEGDNLSVSLTVGRNQTLYLVSAGKKITTDLSTVTTLDELKAAKLSYILSEKGGYTSVIAQPEDIPYAGFVSGVNVVSLGEGAGTVEYNTPEGFMGNIRLSQLVAKVTLKYKYEAETHTLQGVRLQNATTQIGIDGSGTPVAESEVHPLDLKPAGTPDAEGYYTASWYVAANKQGSVPTLLLEQNRYYNKETGQGLAPPLGLNFEILARSKTDAGKYAVYQIYIGNNNTSNFDVEVNHNYTLTTVFTNAPEGSTDERLGETTFSKASLVFYASSRLTTTGGLCTSSGGYDLDAHYDFRPISMEVSGRAVDIGIYTDPECTVLARADQTNWLRLSSDPNYTLAVNNTAAPLNNRIQLEARVPAKLNFYLYNDEYITTQDNAPTRTLYLKVTTTELDVANPAITIDRFRITQHPILPAGRWGGELVNGDYTQWLGVDQIEEYRYIYISNGISVSNLQWGYYGVDTGYATNRNSGYESTIKLAENPDNKRETSGTPAPQKNGGLYQYTYYNSFGARYCYDRNRDLDGSGALEKVNKYGENEIKWYLPAINQGMGIALEKKLGTGIYSYLANEASAGIQYTMNDIVTYTNYDKITNTAPIRCVRDLPPPTGSHSESKVKTMSLPDTGEGNTGSSVYAIIDLTSLSGGIKMKTEAELYESFPLYTDDGKTSLGREVVRVRKHGTSSELNQYCPPRLAYAPTHINPQGEPITSEVSNNIWSNAGGLYDSADDEATTQRIAIEKGCPLYKGRDGKDKPGTWRLPTQRELAPLLLYRTALEATNSQTSFAMSSGSIFSASENGKYYGAIYAMQSVTQLSKSNFAFYVPQIRCVRDIP